MGDEKGMGARGWLKTIAGGVRELAEIGAESVTIRIESEVKALIERFEGDVRVEFGARRLGLSDRMVERIVRAGAKELDDFELLDFGWRDEAYRVRATVQARTVVVNVLLQSARWSTQDVEVRAATPTPPTLEAAPVANWFVARFVELLGGTSFAASVFARKLPEGLTWDGREVTWKRPLDLGMSGMQSMLTQGTKVSATFGHDAEWLWITIDGSLPSVLVIVKQVATRLADLVPAMRRG